MDHIIEEIGTNFVLMRSPEEDFHRNIYLKKFVEDGKIISSMVFDPGTKLDMADLMVFLKDQIGGLEKLEMIFLSHQDPDLTANTPMVMAHAKKSLLITSVDTWRLVKMYGIPQNRVFTTESFDSDIVRIKKSTHKIQFVPAPFCHFKGAMMLYDFESRVLFTGDFFSGVNSQTDDAIFATEEAWEGIKLFHQIYMPTNRAIKNAVDAIAMLDPFPEVIAPQHGKLIKGDLILDFLTRLRELPAGIDIIMTDEVEKEVILLGLNNFLSFLKLESHEYHDTLIHFFHKSNKFTSPFIISNNLVTDIKVTVDIAIKAIEEQLALLADATKYDYLSMVLRDTLEQAGVIFDMSEVSDEVPLQDIVSPFEL